MKKVLFLATVLIGININAQENVETKNELKLNALYFIGGIPEMGYEHIINEESGIGINLLFSIEKDNEPSFALTPYYRHYFGNKFASGFFVEGFGMLNITEGEYYYNYIPYPGAVIDHSSNNETDFALGAALGGKFVSKRGFVFEIYGGVGRNLLNENTIDLVPRFGLTFGKRF